MYRGVALADLGRNEALQCSQLGALELQIRFEERVAEPARRHRARFEIVESIAKRTRQRLDTGDLAVALAHVPEITCGRRRQAALLPDAVEPGPDHCAQGQIG